MKKILRSLSRIVVINFIFFLVVLYFLNKQPALSKAQLDIKKTGPSIATTTPISNPESSKIIEPSPTPPDLFSQIGEHNTRSSCWFIIDGRLYDITPFFGSHPGGDEIMLRYCGTDASNGYHTKGQMVPADHSDSAKEMLKQYLIQ